MTSRERVLKSVTHKEPDSVPIDLGSISVATMNRTALVSLQKYLGVNRKESENTIIIQKRFQNVDVPEEILLKYRIDLRGIRPGKPKNRDEVVFDGGSFVDEWGITYGPSAGGAYYDIVRFPLAETEIYEIEQYLNLDTDNPPENVESMYEAALCYR